MKLTADTITDACLENLIIETLRGRQNAHKRALRNDARDALKHGDSVSRARCAEILNARSAEAAGDAAQVAARGAEIPS